MKVIQVRNVPDAVHAELRSRAALAGMSLSDYALAELSRVAERPSVGDVLRLAQSRSGGTTLEAVVRVVREGRERP